MLVALRTWSRYPVPAAAPAEPAAWRAQGARYAPLVGALVALPAAVAYALSGLWLPHGVALLVALAAAMALTAAMHEREFVAACSVIEAAAPADARRGTLAVVCAVLLMLAKLETLSSIDPSWIGVALVCAAAFSRGCAVFAMAGMGAPAAPAVPAAAVDPGAPAAAVGPVGPAFPGALDLGIATAWSGAPLVAATLWTGDARVFMTAAGGAMLAALLAGRLARRHASMGPQAGFGLAQQAAELAFFLGVLATLSIADETLADPAP